MSVPIRIDFVSDVSCTWCAVALRNLDTALAHLGGEVAPEIRFHPFELNPLMPAGGENLAEHLGAKYGFDRAGLEAVFERIRRSGEPVGIDFRLGAESRIHNTFDAHRLLHWAGLEARQKALKEALFHAHFTQGENPSDHGVLVRLAASVGLDPLEARRVLDSGAFAAEVRTQERKWLDAGVGAVPAIVIDGRHALSGAQPPEVYEQAIRRTMAQAGAGAAA